MSTDAHGNLHGTDDGRFQQKTRAAAAGDLGESLRLSQRLAIEAARTPRTSAPTPGAVLVLAAARMDDVAAASFPAAAEEAHAWLARVTDLDRARLRQIAYEVGPSDQARIDAAVAVMAVARTCPNAIDLGGDAVVDVTASGAWQVRVGETAATGTLPIDSAPGHHVGTSYDDMPVSFKEQVARPLWAAIGARAKAAEGMSSLCERGRHAMCLMCACECHREDQNAR